MYNVFPHFQSKDIIRKKLLGFFLRNSAVYVALLKSLSEGILVNFPPREFRFNVFFNSG